MSEWLEVSKCKIVGAAYSWIGTAPFARSKPLVMHDESKLIGLAGDEYEEGNVKVDLLVDVEGLLVLQPLPLAKYAEVWLFRSNFSFRDEAVSEVLDSKIVLYGPKSHDNIVWLIVQAEKDATQLLRDWCERAETEAIEHAAKHQLADAVNAGLLAYTLCDSPKNAGLYLAVLDVANDKRRHEEVEHHLDNVKGWYFYQASRNEKHVALVRIFKLRCEEILTLKEQNEALILQAKGGDADPITDTRHPGHLLLQLGWHYSPGDPYACEWVDPKTIQGCRSTHALAAALGIALKRFMSQGEVPCP